MIKRILVHRSPAFEDIELYMQNGFNVFSGASGSGKSVFMESLLAIFGIKESNADLIEANIDLESIDIDWVEYGIPQEDDEIVLSILKKDKTRYFINHTSSSKKKLNEIVSGFARHISVKGAEELKPKNLLNIFDDFVCTQIPSHRTLLETFRGDFRTLKEIQEKLAILESQEQNIAQLKELATFEIQKIEAINPKEGEYERLLELKKILSKQEKIKEVICQVHQALEMTPVFENFLNLVDKQCPSLLEGLVEFEALLEREEETLNDLDEVNPEEILNKLSSLAEINRRFGGVKEALAYVKEQKQKLQDYENLTFDKQNLQKQIATLSQKCQENADILHQNREQCKEAFNQKLNAFAVELRLNPSQTLINKIAMNEQGESECQITLGQSAVEVLSSGEYNRLRLAIMCIEAELSDKKGILVLDEIDANLSGEESEGVAKILKKLSQSYQIFAISHQTHMPSLADWHYLVQKDGEKSKIVKLDYQGRVQEIARIISGANVTTQALAFAKGYLAQNGIES